MATIAPLPPRDLNGLKGTALLWVTVALAYAITGRIGLALAIPPGYATAIFPPTGVALSAVLLYRYRALPGVWAGSFLMNLWVSFDHQGHLTATHLQLAALIAAGGAAQAALGARLIRARIEGPIRLDRAQEILTFMLLGGPVACLLGATMGITTLYLYGAISAREAPYSWWSWWVGDAIGVLIVTPVILSFLGEPREAWRPRRLTVTVPLLLTAALTVVLFLVSSRWENEQLESWSSRLRHESDWAFGDHTWRLRVLATPAYLADLRSLQAWFVLAGGLTWSALLGAFLLLISGRAARVELLVAERTSQLEEREGRLSAILSAALDAILTLSPEGRIETLNPAVERLLDADAVRLSGRRLVDFLPGTDWSALVAMAEASGAEGLRRGVEGRSALGRALPLSLSLNRLSRDDGDLYVCLLHDLSDQERSERLKSDFVSTVSHELRTPLTSIRGALGLLRGGVAGPLPEEIDELVGIADQNAARLLGLVGDLLDIEKLSCGKLEISMSETKLLPLLEKSIEENRGYAAEHKVRLSLTASAPGDTVVAVDADRFAQVLNNLLSNAMKFSPVGEAVVVTNRVTGGRVRVSVIDRGPGVPASFRDKLFTKFAQADSGDARRYAGTGLGLHLCKLLVERMGGEIGLESEVGKGATFFVELRCIDPLPLPPHPFQEEGGCAPEVAPESPTTEGES